MSCAQRADSQQAHGLIGPSQASATASVESAIPSDVVCQWARVRSITDGDTIRVDFEDGRSNLPVRYIGMDTPETRKPGTPVQPFGPEAAQDNERLVSGQRLCLERDVSETDRYSRLLRVVWREDGVMVNEQLVLDGFAVLDTFPPDVKYADRFVAAQASARERGVGLWDANP